VAAAKRLGDPILVEQFGHTDLRLGDVLPTP
jgi:hypothetical protein